MWTQLRLEAWDMYGMVHCVLRVLEDTPEALSTKSTAYLLVADVGNPQGRGRDWAWEVLDALMNLMAHSNAPEAEAARGGAVSGGKTGLPDPSDDLQGSAGRREGGGQGDGREATPLEP